MVIFVFMVLGGTIGAAFANGGIETMDLLSSQVLSGDLAAALQNIRGAMDHIGQKTLFGAIGGAVGGTLLGQFVQSLFSLSREKNEA